LKWLVAIVFDAVGFSDAVEAFGEAAFGCEIFS
jgi:hypothetical protein